MVLLLLAQWVRNSYKKREDRDAIIADVAEKYHALRLSNTTGGAHGLSQSGVLRLRHSQEIEKAIEKIKEFGHPDPLASDREALAKKDIYHFLIVLRDNHLNPILSSDLHKAYQLTREK
jgi:hypothetical protein